MLYVKPTLRTNVEPPTLHLIFCTGRRGTKQGGLDRQTCALCVLKDLNYHTSNMQAFRRTNKRTERHKAADSLVFEIPRLAAHESIPISFAWTTESPKCVNCCPTTGCRNICGNHSYANIPSLLQRRDGECPSCYAVNSQNGGCSNQLHCQLIDDVGSSSRGNDFCCAPADIVHSPQ